MLVRKRVECSNETERIASRVLPSVKVLEFKRVYRQCEYLRVHRRALKTCLRMIKIDWINKPPCLLGAVVGLIPTSSKSAIMSMFSQKRDVRTTGHEQRSIIAFI